jgi:hypothetical protein
LDPARVYATFAEQVRAGLDQLDSAPGERNRGHGDVPFVTEM